MDKALVRPGGWEVDLARDAQVTLFDKRGIGASDAVANFSFEERTDDLRAVMDAAEIEAAHLVGSSEGGPMSILFAATYPERVKSLTLYGTFASWMRRVDYPYDFDMTLREYSAWVDRVMNAHLGDNQRDQRWFFELFTPSRAGDEDFLTAMQPIMAGVSPGAARRIWEGLYDIDVRHVLASVRVPTTILHLDGDRVCPFGGAEYLAENIPGTALVKLEGIDHLSFDPTPEVPPLAVERWDYVVLIGALGRAQATRTNLRSAPRITALAVVASTSARASIAGRSSG